MTTDAVDELGHLHERMPVVLEPADWPVWLGEQEGNAAGLLRPSGAGFRVGTVSTRVNPVKNDGPELAEPLQAGTGTVGTVLHPT